MMQTNRQKLSHRLLKVLGLMVSLGLTPSAMAAMVTLTFEGTFSSYSDSANQLPFNTPAAGTKAVYTTTVDTTTLYLQNPTVTALYTNTTSLTFGENGTGYSVGAPDVRGTDGASIIANDVSTTSFLNTIAALNSVDLSGLSEASGEYADFWVSLSRSDTGNSHSFGVLLASSADQLPISPLTANEFVTPTPEEWDQAVIYYLVDGETDSHILFHIDSVSVSQVPIPAAAWLFSSALLGVVGLGRRHRQ